MSVLVQITGDRIPRNPAAVLEGDKPARNDSSFLSPRSGYGQRRRRPEKISRVWQSARARSGINFYSPITIQSIEAILPSRAAELFNLKFYIFIARVIFEILFLAGRIGSLPRLPFRPDSTQN